MCVNLQVNTPSSFQQILMSKHKLRLQQWQSQEVQQEMLETWQKEEWRARRYLEEEVDDWEEGAWGIKAS